MAGDPSRSCCSLCSRRMALRIAGWSGVQLPAAMLHRGAGGWADVRRGAFSQDWCEGLGGESGTPVWHRHVRHKHCVGLPTHTHPRSWLTRRSHQRTPPPNAHQPHRRKARTPGLTARCMPSNSACNTTAMSHVTAKSAHRQKARMRRQATQQPGLQLATRVTEEKLTARRRGPRG